VGARDWRPGDAAGKEYGSNAECAVRVA